MKSKKCSSCSSDIKSNVHVCPRCGTIQNVKPSPLLWIGILVFPFIFSWLTLKIGYSKNVKIIAFSWMVAFLGFSVINSEKNHQNNVELSSEVQTEKINQNVHELQSADQNQLERNWLYSQEYDKLRNKTSYWATCSSQQIKNFGFPYQKVQQQIILRKRPLDGFNIMIALTEGQFSCGINGCQIVAKFDEKPIKTYSVTRAEDGDFTTLFISNKTSFLNNIKKSKKVIIEASFFQHGSESFDFQVSGLDWKY